MLIINGRNTQAGVTSLTSLPQPIMPCDILQEWNFPKCVKTPFSDYLITMPHSSHLGPGMVYHLFLN